MRNKIPVNINKASEQFLLNRIKDRKANAYYKKGTFTNSIVWGVHEYIVPKVSNKQMKIFGKGIFLFVMVRKDAKAFLKRNPEIKLPKKYNQIEYNGNLDADLFGNITGTDLNHAYWRIAYNLGIISERTYEKGLPPEFKNIRLAALSTLGASKAYQIIKDGVLTNSYKMVEGDEKLQQVYRLIRYTCYGYMNSLKRKLGKDFVCYKTDCIYYANTKENRSLVRQFFKDKDLLMKQLY